MKVKSKGGPQTLEDDSMEVDTPAMAIEQGLLYPCSKIILLCLFTAPAGPSKDKGEGKAANAGSGAMQVDLQAISSQNCEKHYLHPKNISSPSLDSPCRFL